MRSILDLHIHSKYSGGTSPWISIEKIANACKIKGINIVGTGDCLHPVWSRILKNKLDKESSGVYIFPKTPETKFILQTEVELNWKVNHNLKRVHFIILFPNFNILDEISEKLSQKNNLFKDGRPKIFLTPEQFINLLKSFENTIEIIPAHIFTPYFGILGSECAFKSLEDALGNSIDQIHILESGLSADPPLIRTIKELNNRTVISNSDAHSLNFHRIGREATVLELKKLTYQEIIKSLKENKIVKTYEFRPSAGKYYYDGHRRERHLIEKEYFCSPKRKLKICPYCDKKLTKGVLSRVYELSDQESLNDRTYQYVVPVLSLIYEIKSRINNNDLMKNYLELMRLNQGEYNIWEGRGIYKGIDTEIVDVISKIKDGKFYFSPGFDGVYGKLQF